MIALLSLWRYFSFNREALQSCGDDILRHNARSLMIISIVTVLLLLLFGGVSVVLERSQDKALVVAGAGALEFAVFLYISRLCGQKKYAKRRVYAALGCYFVFLLGFGICLSVFFTPEYYGVNFIVFLICSQVVFVLNPPLILLLNAAAVSVFACLGAPVKPPQIWRSDLVNAAIAALIGMALSWYMSRSLIKVMITSRRFEQERNRFREESIRDELTGLSNRRDYLNAVNFYISVCHHVHQTVCAVMMDVDYFKNYNDYYGHQKGDAVLKSIGDVLRRLSSEEHAFTARVGGEEFIVLWTENRIAEAERVALKLRQMIIDLQIPHEKSAAAPHITASFGLYIQRGGSADTAEDLYRNADSALYMAKKNGRNCIMCINSEDKTAKMVQILPPHENIGRQGGRSLV